MQQALVSGLCPSQDSFASIEKVNVGMMEETAMLRVDH